MKENKNFDDRPVCCPRCGYDLHGLIETWKHDCPINGVCTECGLEFEWGELLCPRRAVPRWCVEYAQGWGIALAAIKTLLVMLWPRKFWRDLKMVHDPRWRRLPAFILLTLALLYVVFATHVGFASYRSYQWATSSAPPGTTRDPLVIGLYATINPFSTYSVTIVTVGRNATSVPPRTYALHCNPVRFFRNIRAAVRSNQFSKPWTLDEWSWRMKRSSVFIAHCFMIAFLSPFAFLVLPQTLRRAKVRYRHLVRIGFYSLFFLVPPILFIMHKLIMFNNTILRSDDLNPYFTFFLPVICLIIWWSLAAKHYLKLPHAWCVGISMVVLAYAVGLFLVSVIDFLTM